MNLYTIGFTQKRAEQFFSLLARHGVKRVLDIRLNNRSQLAGFAKRDDLGYFLKALCGIEYLFFFNDTATTEILAAYKHNGGNWPTYEQQFLALLEQRRVAATLESALFEDACLLCSEHQPHHCHRRLVAEHLSAHWDGVEIRHLT